MDAGTALNSAPRFDRDVDGPANRGRGVAREGRQPVSRGHVNGPWQYDGIQRVRDGQMAGNRKRGCCRSLCLFRLEASRLGGADWPRPKLAWPGLAMTTLDCAGAARYSACRAGSPMKHENC